MKKTINGLLLAMAVCAIPSYGKILDDDTTMESIINTETNLMNTAEKKWDTLLTTVNKVKEIPTMISELENEGLITQQTQSDPSAVARNLQAQIEAMNKKLTSSSVSNAPEKTESTN